MSTKVDTAGKELNWPTGNTIVISVTGQINKQLLQGPLYYIVGGMFSNQPKQNICYARANLLGHSDLAIGVLDSVHKPLPTCSSR